MVRRGGVSALICDQGSHFFSKSLALHLRELETVEAAHIYARRSNLLPLMVRDFCRVALFNGD